MTSKTPKLRKPSGFVFYRGPSMLDGKPIVAILTGLNGRGKNGKTGNGLLQTWILRADMNPLEAVRKGKDSSICGDCKHRGAVRRDPKTRKLRNVGRSCYVRLDTAPNNIFKTYKRGRYPVLSPTDARNAIQGKLVRGGSYGDPAAVPFHIWASLQHGLDSGTAYTHQWRRFPELAAFAMASVDSASERLEAKLLGFRTFRVRSESEPLQDREIACPAAKESNYRTTCDLCRACGGTAAKARVDMAIIVHGSGKASHFTNAQAAA
jgi:hypothetical protein